MPTASRKREVPGGVKAISILEIIGGALGIIGGIMLAAGAGFLGIAGEAANTAAGAYDMSNGVFTALAGVGIFFGVVIILLGILGIFIAVQLWKGKNWARIVTIVFASLGLLSALSSLGSSTTYSLVMIVIDAFIIWYLGFNAAAKAAFKS